MVVFRNSRYRFLGKYQVEDKLGAIEQVYELREFPRGTIRGMISHTVKASETFEQIAFKYYGDPAKWYVLADANPQIFFPLDLQAGAVIVIPPLFYASSV